jgi:hypothetical protein
VSETRGTSRELTAGHVWAIAFVYSAVVALLVQLVLLPHVFPAWHWRDGLLAGGDWVHFHLDAVYRAGQIRTKGWSAFELRPMANSPVGIASAIYALTWPKPWTLIPLNAALHATGAALLFHLLRIFVADWRWAAIGTGPFLIYPSALMWVSQIHRDGFFIAGYLSLFAAWAELAREGPAAAAHEWKRLAPAAALLAVGLGLIWVARPDQLVVSQVAAGVALAVLAVTAAVRLRRGTAHRWRSAAAIALMILAIVGASWFPSSRLPRLDRTAFREDPFVGESRVRGRAAVLITTPRPAVPDMAPPGRGVGAIPWYRTEWLPVTVDRLAYRIALVRENFLVFSLASQTNIDADVGFYRATDLVRYLPRALQVALLAPFPTEWGRAGSLTWTTATRRLVAVEMLGVYAALLALLAVVWQWRRRAELWVVLLPCLAALVPYALLIPNLGALYRFRYGFLMTLDGLGVAGGLDLLSRRVGLKTRAGSAERWPRRGRPDALRGPPLPTRREDGPPARRRRLPGLPGLSARRERRVERLEPPDVRLDRERAGHPRSGGGAEATRQRRVVEQALQRGRDRPGGAGVDHQPGLAVDHELLDAPDRRGHAREAEGHGLHEDVGHALMRRRQHEDVGGPEHARQIRPVPQQVHAPGEPLRSGQRRECVS